MPADNSTICKCPGCNHYVYVKEVIIVKFKGDLLYDRKCPGCGKHWLSEFKPVKQ